VATNAFRDVLQGASNGVASNLSAPVDGINWLLRKAGLPMGDMPVGGSNWLRKQGLTADPENANYGLLGEALGGITPMLAAVKAPQIASGLLKAGENMAIPNAMNRQAGAIVWHGSPHKFDAFDASKIGTGEGLQAYGHGLYLADAPEIATGYQAKLSQLTNLVDGKVTRDLPSAVVGNQLSQFGGDVDKTRNYFLAKASEYEKMGQSYKPAMSRADEFQSYANQVEEFASKSFKKNTGSLYKVDLPDEHIAKMLNYDEAVPEALRAPLSKAALDQFGSGISMGSGEQLIKQVADQFKFAGHANPNVAASEWLSSQGIPGIRYLDGGSRGAGSGSSNYVVFPGSERLMKILERNGQPVNLPNSVVRK
jgi:hypothetical protein